MEEMMQNLNNPKQQILNNELRLYQYVISSVSNKKIGLEGRASLPNPFKSYDKKHSFSIYNHAGRLYFKEHGDGGYSGDIFEFMARYFNLDSQSNFKEICKRSLKLLNIYMSNIDVRSSGIKQKPQDIIKKSLSVKEKEFTAIEYEYWRQSGITPDVLAKYNVKSIFSYQTKNGMTIDYKKSKYIFAYALENACYKIYQPFNSKFKWSWIGQKPKDYIFGIDQLPESGELLLISAGERDTLTLVSHGYSAICFNSETATFPNQLIDSLKERFKNVAIIYDADKTGEKRSVILSDEYEIDIIKLADVLPAEYGNDVSDYYTARISGKLSSDIGLENLVKDYLHTKNEENYALNAVPDSVYKNLPPLLSKCVEDVVLQHEKEIIFFSCLTAMASPFYNYKIYYDNKYNYPNLCLQIIAKAAGGKANTIHSRNLIDPIHQYYKELQLKKAQKSKQKEDKQSHTEIMVPGLHYPDRSTEPAVAELMSNSLGATGIIYANELDSLINSRKTEYGDLSVIIREAFQNETYMKTLKRCYV